MLRSRIYIGMLPIIGILTLICIYFVINQNRQIDRIKELQEVHYATTSNLDRLLLIVSEIERVLSLKQKSDPELLQRIYDSSKATMRTWTEGDNESVAKAQALIPLLDNFLSITDRYLSDPSTNQSSSPATSVRVSAESIETTALEISTFHNNRIREINQEFEQQAAIQYYIIVTGIVLSVLTMGVMAYLLSQRILAPIDSLTDAAIKMADNDWESDYQPTSKDEIQSLEIAFVEMTRRIRDYKKITSRQMVQIRRRMEACFDRFPHPVLFVNKRHELIYLNPAGSRLTKAMGEVDSFPPRLKESIQNVFSTGRNILPTDFEETIAIKIDNEEEYFLPIVIRIDSEEEDFVECALILQNVTSLRLSDELKSDMIATVSHEIKTPVTSATLAIHLLLENSLGDLNEDQKEMLETTKSDLDRLSRILDHLLEIARLENTSKITKLSIDIEPLIDRVVEGHSIAAQEKGIILTKELEPEISTFMADPRALEVALSNYLSNALKYSHPNTTVLIYAKRSGQSLRLGVKDEGPGIGSEDLAFIFDKFYRSTRQSAQAGVGLGLSIVKEIALSHDGNTGCEHVEPTGCDFWISLPQG